MIVDIIISFCSREGLGEVSTGVEITCSIRLHQDCASHKEGGIRHKQEGARDIRNTKDGCG